MTDSPAWRQPYPGLRPFKREETDLFFGREDCVDSLIDILAQQRFLAVLGSSGSGKSSLVKTGLLAGLELGLMAKARPHWRRGKASLCALNRPRGSTWRCGRFTDWGP
jgi:hypothetical protein